MFLVSIVSCFLQCISIDLSATVSLALSQHLFKFFYPRHVITVLVEHAVCLGLRAADIDFLVIVLSSLIVISSCCQVKFDPLFSSRLRCISEFEFRLCYVQFKSHLFENVHLLLVLFIILYHPLSSLFHLLREDALINEATFAIWSIWVTFFKQLGSCLVFIMINCDVLVKDIELCLSLKNIRFCILNSCIFCLMLAEQLL